MKYGIMARGSPWVTTYLLYKKCLDPPRVMHHQCVSVAITVEGKLRATGPLVTDVPKHGRQFIIIERIPRINEDIIPVLLLGVLCLEEAH